MPPRAADESLQTTPSWESFLGSSRGPLLKSGGVRLNQGSAIGALAATVLASQSRSAVDWGKRAAKSFSIF